jgi:hypothetical protein
LEDLDLTLKPEWHPLEMHLIRQRRTDVQLFRLPERIDHFNYGMR